MPTKAAFVVFLFVALPGRGTELRAQSVRQRFSAGVNAQVAGQPMGIWSVGAEVSGRLVARRWWDAGVALSASKAAPERIMCPLSSNGPCDSRRIGQFAVGEGVLTIGTPARRAYVVIGAGGFVSRWGSGVYTPSMTTVPATNATGAGPGGALIDGGIGSRPPVLGDRLLFELRLRRYLHVPTRDHADGLTFAVRWLIR